MPIESAFKIYKIGKTVFQLGDLNADLDQSFIQTITAILDKGLKFVPCMHTNIVDIFTHIVNSFDRNLVNFNAKLVFHMNKKPINRKDSDVQSICQSFNCNLDKLRHKNYNPGRFPMLKESLEFRLEFLQQLSNYQYTFESNLSMDQIRSIKQFMNERPFSVIQCDKNIGTCVISNELLDKLSQDYLSDDKTYTRLNIDPTESIVNTVNRELDNLQAAKHVSKRLCGLLRPRDYKIGKFRILAKLHKHKFGIRPIVNCRGHPTSKISQLIDLILQPIIKSTDTYIQDSQHLLQKLDEQTFDAGKMYLYSCDFESLYTNIKKEDAISLICDYMRNKLDPTIINTTGLARLLGIVFECNIFKYKEKFYIQIVGVAMGCIAGPSIAVLFVYILESKWLVIHRPLIYFRFIDDIIYGDKEPLDTTEFVKIFLNLKLNINTGDIINFLDLNIKFDRVACKLNFDLYIKPTNTYGYLLSSSNHPSFIFNNIPKSIFLRIRRICTDYTNYMYHCRNIIDKLLARGYDLNKLKSTAYGIGKQCRNSLIPYKSKKTFSHADSIWFGLSYDMNFKTLNTNIINAFSSLSNNKLDGLHIKLFNTISPNLASLFVFGNNSKCSVNKTRACNETGCATCQYVSDHRYIRLGKQMFVPFVDKSNCNSKNVVYIVKCKLCTQFYIGQTINIRDRIKQHLRSIRKFKIFIHYTSEIGIHFNKYGHNFLNDFEFSIYSSNIDNKEDRLSIESDLIHYFVTFHDRQILNTYRPSPLYISKTCFAKK